MTWRPSKSPRECSGINRRDTVSCFVIHKYGNGKQRLLVAAEPCASFQLIQSRRVHTKERRTYFSLTLGWYQFRNQFVVSRHDVPGNAGICELAFWKASI